MGGGVPDLLVEVGRLEHAAPAEDDGPLDRVGQLPDVAGPGIALEDLQRLGSDRGRRPAVELGRAGHEVMRPGAGMSSIRSRRLGVRIGTTLRR